MRSVNFSKVAGLIFDVAVPVDVDVPVAVNSICKMVILNTVSGKKKYIFICGALRDLVSFVQFKKREKRPWRNVNFSKVAG